MERLKPCAANVLLRLMARMQACTYMKITQQEYKDLVLEKLPVLIHTPAGAANLYRLSHQLLITGVEYVDPEMVFLTIATTKDGSSIIPVSYRCLDADMETGIDIKANRIMSYDKEVQAGHACFANVWLKNILAQGFLAVPTEEILLKQVA